MKPDLEINDFDGLLKSHRQRAAEHRFANPRFDDSGSGELLDKRESGSIWAAVVAPLVCLLLGWNAPAIYSALVRYFGA